MAKIPLLVLLLAALLFAACRPTVASAPPELATQETILAQVVTPIPKATPISTPPPHYPTPPPPEPPCGYRQMSAPKTPEEFAAYNAQREKENACIDAFTGAKKGFITRSSGPETKGAVIDVPGKNKRIKLPDDAYLAVGPSRFECGGASNDADRGKLPKCPRFPTYVVARGNSNVSVDGDGQLYDEKIAPGEERIFDFLREALK